MKKTKQGRFLTVKSISSDYGIKKSTLYWWVRNRALPFYRVGKQIFFREDELLGFLESHRQGGEFD